MVGYLHFWHAADRSNDASRRLLAHTEIFVAVLTKLPANNALIRSSVITVIWDEWLAMKRPATRQACAKHLTKG